ncbi:MAG: hypothetical protein LBN30_08670 [Oscillospiraceae bacterium]|jgi:uncharacterized repeat protein (TIGR01451 family)|nr:hypothetical protein [Oscillospiraceae bacterium]
MQKARPIGKKMRLLIGISFLLVAAIIVTIFSLTAQAEKTLIDQRAAESSQYRYRFAEMQAYLAGVSGFEFYDYDSAGNIIPSTRDVDKVLYYYDRDDNIAVYCVEPEKPDVTFAEFGVLPLPEPGNSDGHVVTFTELQKKLLAYVLAYGVREWNGSQDINNMATIEKPDQIATQIAVWMVSTGHFNYSKDPTDSDDPIDPKNNPSNPDYPSYPYKDYFDPYYDILLPPGGAGIAPDYVYEDEYEGEISICEKARSLIRRAGKAIRISQTLPDFAGHDFQMTWNDTYNTYAVTIHDESGMLSYWEKSLDEGIKEANKKLTNPLKIEFDLPNGNITIIGDPCSDNDNTVSIKAQKTDDLVPEATLIYLSHEYPAKIGPDYQDMLSVETSDLKMELDLGLTLRRAYDAALQKWVSDVKRLNVSAVLDDEGGVIETQSYDSIYPSPIPDSDHSSLDDNGIAEKSPIYKAQRGDVVEYSIRVLNQCHERLNITEIVDYLPSGLEFDADLNATLGGSDWIADSTLDEHGAPRPILRYIGSPIPLVPEGSSDGNYDAVLKVYLRIAVSASKGQVIVNYAEISAMTDDKGVKVDDVDSTPDKNDWDDGEVTDNEVNNGNDDEDDHDYAMVEVDVPPYDAALQKWVARVVRGGKTVDELDDVEDGEASDIVTVHRGDTVIYKIRVINQGEYPLIITDITDYLPAWLTFDEEHPINKGKWIETDKVDETGQGRTFIRYIGEGGIHLAPAGDEQHGDRAVVEIAATVSTAASDGMVIHNSSEITRMTDDKGGEVDDVDSTPDDEPDNDKKPPKDNEVVNEDDDEDDEDFAEIIVEVPPYDAALKKWVSAVQRNGVTVATHDEPFTPSAFDEVQSGDVVVFAIKVYNQCEFLLRVGEITDYLPEGLTFDQILNPNWVLTGDLLTYTGLAETTLYVDQVRYPNAPAKLVGESTATVTIALIVDGSKLTVDVPVINYAEISLLTDEYNVTVADIDSDPDQNRDNDGTFTPGGVPPTGNNPVYDNEIEQHAKTTPGVDEDDHDVAGVVLKPPPQSETPPPSGTPPLSETPPPSSTPPQSETPPPSTLPPPPPPPSSAPPGYTTPPPPPESLPPYSAPPQSTTPPSAPPTPTPTPTPEEEIDESPPPGGAWEYSPTPMPPETEFHEDVPTGPFVPTGDGSMAIWFALAAVAVTVAVFVLTGKKKLK